VAELQQSGLCSLGAKSVRLLPRRLVAMIARRLGPRCDRFGLLLPRVGGIPRQAFLIAQSFEAVSWLRRIP